MSVGPCSLAGLGILVTRPAAQSQGLCRLIESSGGRPVPFPTVEIGPPADPAAALSLLSQSWDILIFVSRNAVERALAMLSDAGATQDQRVGAIHAFGGAKLAAVGRATAAALQEAGASPDLVPERGHDSEALLALPELTQVAGRRVLIVRGEGGRALLSETLRARGAEVAFAEVYRREVPNVDAEHLLPTWQREVQILTATSDQVLQNLLDLLPHQAHGWLHKLPLAVLSERNAQTAMQLGFRTVAVARETSDDGLCDALCRLSLQAGRPH